MAKKSKPTPKKVQPTSESIEAASSRPTPVATPQKKARSVLLSSSTSKAFSLVVLAAVYSPLSQIILSPVYGSIPAATYHKYGLMGSSVLAFALRGSLPRFVERGLPIFAFWIPTIHLVLFKYSAALGNPIGPLVIELVTCFPLITWSLYMANKVFENVDIAFLTSETFEESAPSMIFYLLFTLIERVFRDALPRVMGFGFYTSRIGLQLIIAVIYGLMLPSSLFWPAIPSVVVTMTLNVHNPLQRTTDVLNNTLALQQFALLERHESVTGYVSVIEDRQKGFRAMRCDHSLLGGQWLDPPLKNPERKVAEPIYAVFTMMEAVRLVEPPKVQTTQSTGPKRALNIGLGIGTAPSALIAHGINTTIVEIDPVVYHYARKYFGLPAEHTHFLGDANDFVDVNAAAITEDRQYDYILHDVFTGGAVPTSLFTHEFLSSLSRLLRPDGTIAINYAGDLNMFSASMIHSTITDVFPNCRVFREEPETQPRTGQDFTNLVYFCAHPQNQEPIKFRKPVKADYLGSGARQQFLVPKHELDPEDKFLAGAQVIRKGTGAIKILEKYQAMSAIGHWHLMRTVIPDFVWENW